MDAAKTIRESVQSVATLRRQQAAQPGLAAAVSAVKTYQAGRFALTYADMLAAGRYSGAARFFLVELYGDKDFAERDAQFARIAGALARLFPADVVQLAVSLARLHALTENLDHELARHWQSAGGEIADDLRYVGAWRAAGGRDLRERQLSSVLSIGWELDRLTRAPGLRIMLRMMRGAARAAGLGALQQFLETGFDTFAAMRGAEGFLQAVHQREKDLMDCLFDEADLAVCAAKLRSR